MLFQELPGRQIAEPQKSLSVACMPIGGHYCDDHVQHQLQLPEHSPLSSCNSRAGDLEASDSISPIMKTRKSSSQKNIPEKDLGSPKAKNWKDKLFRRGGGSSSSGSHSADVSPSNLSAAARTTGSIGVPLRSCPMVIILSCSPLITIFINIFFFSAVHSPKTTSSYRTLWMSARI